MCIFVPQTSTTDDDQYSEIKAELRHELQLLRSKVLGMIKANEELPDIEKLDRQEFILDTEEHHRLLQEEQEAIDQVIYHIPVFYSYAYVRMCLMYLWLCMMYVLFMNTYIRMYILYVHTVCTYCMY